MKKLLLMGASLVVLGFSSGANAADMPVKARPLPAGCAVNDITRSNNQISLDFAATNFNYLERDNTGVPLDSEKGWVPGVSVAGSGMWNIAGICNVYVSGQFTYLSGHTDYWAGGGPVTSNTDGAKVYDEDFRLGKGFDLSNNVMLTPFAGLGWHLWKRNLTGPSGYSEDYSNGYWGGGLLLQYAPVSRLVLSANGLVGRTFNSQMHAYQNGGFPIPDMTFGLGSSTIIKAGVSADYALTQQWHANVGVDYTDFRYGASAVNSLGYLEPDSRTKNWTVKAGFGYAY